MSTQERKAQLRARWSTFITICSIFIVTGCLIWTADTLDHIDTEAVEETEEDISYVSFVIEDVPLVEEPTPPAWVMDDDDYYLFARIIYAEFGESEEGMYYIGSVILNQLESDDFPDEIYKLVHYKNLWSTKNTKKEPSDVALEIAEELLATGSINKDIFFVHKGRPVKGTETVIQIGDIYFSK